MCDVLSECQDCREPAIKLTCTLFFCAHPVWLQMRLYVNGNLREAWTRSFSLLVLQVLPMYLQGLHVHLHVPCVYIKPTVQPVFGYSSSDT